VDGLRSVAEDAFLAKSARRIFVRRVRSSPIRFYPRFRSAPSFFIRPPTRRAPPPHPVQASVDVSDNFHLPGYVGRGVENTEQTDRYSWYASVLFTF
jgi:hypothetical protein